MSKTRKKRAAYGLVALCVLSLVVGMGCGRKGNSGQVASQGNFTPQVFIEHQGGTFRIIRNGAPWYVQGAAGDGQYLENLADAGGNTLRLYWQEDADSLLEKAHQLGLAVIMDLPIPQIRSGFDYGNAQKVDSLIQHLVQIVSRLDTFPALLMWCAGNEFDLQREESLVSWRKLNKIVASIQQADPDHPVMTATQAGSLLRYAKIMSLAPALDVLGINLFKEIASVRTDWESLPEMGKKPYLLTEWAPLGTWQANQTAWEAPIEPNSQQKSELYRLVYENEILADSINCLGSCAFYWGQKQERTHTWYSLFTESGEKTSMVDILANVWKGKQPANLAPDMQAISIKGFASDSIAYLMAGKEYTAWMYYRDAEGDTLSQGWEIVPEGSYRQRFGGEKERRPQPMNHLTLDAQGDWFHFRAPATSGAFRLFAYVKDPNGGTGSANLPFFVVYPSPTPGLSDK